MLKLAEKKKASLVTLGNASSVPLRGNLAPKITVPAPAREAQPELELTAAWDALQAAKLEPEDVDLLICSSFQADVHGIGNAAFLARDLGLTGAAWNLESACSSALVAFQTACSLVESGQYRTMCWWSAPAPTLAPRSSTTRSAGASATRPRHSSSARSRTAPDSWVDTPCTPPRPVKPSPTIWSPTGDGPPRLRIRTGKQTAEILRGTSESYLKECCHGALESAGLVLSDIDHFRLQHAARLVRGLLCPGARRRPAQDHERLPALRQRRAGPARSQSAPRRSLARNIDPATWCCSTPSAASPPAAPR